MICDTCGQDFFATRAGHVQCRPCRRKRDRPHGGDHHKNRKRILEAREFVGVDGEGITSEAGNHRYVLLTVGDRSLHNDGRKLSTLSIFEFLYEQLAEHPNAAFVGFYLGYDFAQWFRDLPEERARMLLTPTGMAKRKRRLEHLPPFPVRYECWEFDILPMRRFRLRPETPKHDAPWLTICDVGPFFQCSFLKAIDPKKSSAPVVTQAEFDLIAVGKDGRTDHRFGPDMIRYNIAECAVLARLMTQQRDGLLAENIRLRKNQWIGPGQAAAAWFKNIGAPKGEVVRTNSDPLFRDAARESYFGGWFEIFWHGISPGTSWAYDINSAYPKIMSELPCLLHGRYGESEARWTLIKARLYGRHPIVGSALHRTPKGKVLRPHNTIGWYWRHEIEAARVAGFIDRVEILEVRGYQPCNICAPPLAPIAELYQGRIAVGKNTPAGKARKLIYNSGYGKTAQSVGAATYANAIYASLITAGCRTMILDAIRTHPKGAHDLLMVATDSVVFRSRHPGLDIDAEKLGAWTESQHQNLSLFMPGVYWDDDTRERLKNGDDPLLKSRGIGARDLAERIDRLDAAWSRFGRDGWPRLVLPIGFQLVSPKQALARNKWRLCGTLVKDGKRIISSDPTPKRIATMRGRSRPYHWCDPKESTPYDRKFGEEMAELDAMEFGDHPDMPISGMLPALFRS